MFFRKTRIDGKTSRVFSKSAHKTALETLDYIRVQDYYCPVYKVAEVSKKTGQTSIETLL